MITCRALFYDEHDKLVRTVVCEPNADRSGWHIPPGKEGERSFMVSVSMEADDNVIEGEYTVVHEHLRLK